MSYSEDTSQRLREPKGKFQEVIRQLAEIAMSVTHHDASDDEPGYILEVRVMERRFTNLLRGKMKP